VNEYWADHPDDVLGEMRAVRGAYSAQDLTVAAAGDTTAALARALARMADSAAVRGLTWTPAPDQARAAAPSGPRSRHPDGYLQASASGDGTFTQTADGIAVPFPVPASQGAELRALLRVRDAVTSLLDAEAATLDDPPELGAMRQALNARYDEYVRTH